MADCTRDSDLAAIRPVEIADTEGNLRGKYTTAAKLAKGRRDLSRTSSTCSRSATRCSSRR